MERVLGIGGVFIRAKEPKKLAEWYLQHLGVNLAPTDMSMQPWITEQGVTVFAPFDKDTDCFSKELAFMLNFRVSDLDAMMAQLRAAEIVVTREEQMDGIGRFARIHDPEGNPIELWEPISNA